jgi:uncharacterized protein (DUF2267 family)
LESARIGRFFGPAHDLDQGGGSRPVAEIMPTLWKPHKREGAMSNTGLAVFDTTIKETNHWLKAVEAHMHRDNRQLAYLFLRATLQSLRDRLPPENAVHLAAQLPLLLRGVFFEGWKMSATPTTDRHVDEFIDHVRQKMPPDTAFDSHLGVKASLQALAEHIDPGEVSKVMRTLPKELQSLWPAAS